MGQVAPDMIGLSNNNPPEIISTYLVVWDEWETSYLLVLNS